MVGVALFGCGRIGRVHAAAVADHPGAELVFVCDPLEAAAREVAALYGSRATSEVEQVLADPGVEAVIVASPTPTHLDLLTRAVRAGKPVLCEKPIDLDLARVDACWAAIAGDRPVVMIGFNRRFDPSFGEIHRRVTAGEIGRLEQLVITSRDPAPPPAAYVASSGGLFRDMTIHDLDLGRWFLGEVAEVYAAGSNLVSEEIAAAKDIDGAVLVLRGASGALCQIVNSRRCAFGYDQRLEAFGALGMLNAANLLPTGVRLSDGTRTEAAAPYLNFFLDRYAPAYRAELDHFLAAVEGRAAPLPSFADGREALALADAAEESLRTGRAVRPVRV